MQELKLQSGRSMVEMLGVLAVIGVLSIGGIMGYSYGMDKYRANQTMQDVNLRGIDVLAQYDRTGDANLNEWQNEKTIYPITLENETIGIQVDEVPERVCDMLAEGMSHVTTGIKVNGAYVTGDNNTCDGDENTLVFYFEEESVANVPVLEQCGDVVCKQCEVCDQNTMTCVTVSDYEIKCPLSNNQHGWCVGGICKEDPCNCSSNQYCADTNESDTEAHPSGTCVDLEYISKEVDSIMYYASKNKMSWWDASSFCNVLGSSLLYRNKLTVFVEDDLEPYQPTPLANQLSSILTSSCWTKDTMDSLAEWTYLGGSDSDLTERNLEYHHALCRKN